MQSDHRASLRVIQVLGLIAAILFLVTKSPFLLEKLTPGFHDEGEIYHGDMFLECRIKRFKIPLPEAFQGKIKSQPGLTSDVPLLVIGDSFFYRRRGYDSFPYQLSKNLNVPVYYNPDHYEAPFQVIRDAGLERRVLLMECAERLVRDRFLPAPQLNPPPPDSELQGLQRVFHDFKARWLTRAESNYRFFLRYSLLTSPIVESWNSFLFEQFGIISDRTPVYQLDPPHLFLFAEAERGRTSSSLYPISDQEVDAISKHLSDIERELRVRYNVHLVFMPVPNKFTIMGPPLARREYNQLLPRLYSRLEKLGVPTVNLLEPFLASEKTLYFQSDSHWNADGVNLAMERVLPILESHLKQQ
jgi:hypothetical protein